MSSAIQTPPAAVRSPRPQRAGALPAPPDAEDVVWRELDREFRRYDAAARLHRIAYLAMRLVALLVAAAVTVLAAIDAHPALTASLAAVVVVAEGAQQLFQLHTRWISYRTAAETLRREAFRYVAELPPYTEPALRRARLASVLQDVTSRENTTWLEGMRQETGVGMAR
ncbi:DUF4231 domain-containing protein [Geodermatophilus sp. URMC 64]